MKKRMIVFFLKMLILGPFWIATMTLLINNGEWHVGLYSFIGFLIASSFVGVKKQTHIGSKREIVITSGLILLCFPIVGLLFHCNIIKALLAGVVLLMGTYSFLLVAKLVLDKISSGTNKN
ncbi:MULTISPECIES: hypothetical protein [Paenibacillus]|uniref:Uncharacterized protein n=2 Tax=Paenibacillus TaxID=44249 RepID=A0A1V4HN74_9BACL|nr:MULTISPECIES: hypothetical protein [Paenibacillus]MEC0229604.1 hypothetical protein [Paenibacillus alba]OPH59243.1 hypothetical protein BC351_20205 [Paenibacillus ferrarius]